MKDNKRDIQYWNKIKFKSFLKSKRKRAIVRGGSTALQVWFEGRLRQCNGRCSECGCRITNSDERRRFWSICHVLPKGIFKSIEMHNDNWIELCADCHTHYDSSWEHLQTMRIYKEVLGRFRLFKDDIAEDEVRRIPDIFFRG